MSSTMMMERTGMGMAGMGVPGLGTPGLGSPTGVSPSTMLMVPRCTLKFEKVQGGMKIVCSCDDKMAISTLQTLCTMLQGGMCSCCTMMNGMMVYGCNLTMGVCKCDMTDSGVTFTCTSGDSKCGEMISACCDCLSCMMTAGCTCCVLVNNTPVACGCYETSPAGAKTPAKR
jgi:hypothetical protein